MPRPRKLSGPLRRTLLITFGITCGLLITKGGWWTAAGGMAMVAYISHILWCMKADQRRWQEEDKRHREAAIIQRFGPYKEFGVKRK